ncbi:BglII/BstYI family type II restriction endonuclease [Kocuria rhizophila]|uniref:BglII/BstYI family type II restriction endonuclease n=1 Tax=Kocuria rhizophila TaxID=72000 RepID=UPI001909E336|nr:BglII/BstYI family type II restriction endonuclease [Kocuria rhizophila]MBK4120916.1 restriction endonuclease [Kocuria rhizophila]
MELTESWKSVFPQDVQDRYFFCETRSAAAIMKVTTPQAFQDLIDVLQGFELTWDKLTTPGGNRSVISAELDEAFRVRGWREARFEQDLTTRLTISPWGKAPEPEKTRTVETQNSYGGHKIDNVMGRAALDVEWNPKDGNLDRDIANYLSLHEGGLIDVGVMLVRSTDVQPLTLELIAAVKGMEITGATEAWATRMRKLATNPYATSTTANYEKLRPRLERGDAHGCPLLAIGITSDAYREPDTDLATAVEAVATTL